MEDFVLVRRLRRLGRIGISGRRVLTSPRRWRRDGVWRTTARNWLAVAAWTAGVGPERIARWTGRAVHPAAGGPAVEPAVRVTQEKARS